MNRVKAPAASSLKAVSNSLAVKPATEAYFLRSLLPVSTAICTLDMNLLMEVPPISAEIPTEDMAAAKARICDSLIPRFVPAEASLMDISTISLSVVAKLLPRATTAEPRRE